MFFILLLGLSSCANEPQAATAQEGADKIVPGQKQSEESILRHPIRNDGTIDSSQLPIITFEEEVYDFGVAEEGSIIRHSYKFTNTGQAPLLISYARSTCGCTVPEWPQEPIAPGESGQISVKFDATNRVGRQSKPITIISNTIPNKTVIKLIGRTVAKEENN